MSELLAEDEQPHFILEHRLVLPYWISLPNGAYQIELDGRMFTLQLRNDGWRVSIRNPYDHEGEAGYGIDIEDNLDGWDERFAEAPYVHKEKERSMIVVNHQVQCPDPRDRDSCLEVATENSRELAELTLRLVNRLIRVYRCENVPDKVAWEVNEFHLGGKWLETIYIDGERVWGPIPLGYDAYMLAKKPFYNIPPQAAQRIQEKLQEGHEPPWWRQTLEHAQTLHRVRNYRIAVVEYCLSLEVFLSKFIQQKFETRDLPDEIIDHIFERAGLRKLAKDLLRLATGDGLPERDNQLHEALVNASELRNQIVHRHREDVNQEECDAVRDAVIGVIEHLDPDQLIATDAEAAPEPERPTD